jgi:holo-[acyl-carrier protein] synthase
MAVWGIGVDVVDVERFERALRRTPALKDRLFGDAADDLPAHSLAARFAAKEAALKAFGGNIPGFSWLDIQVSGERGMQPKLVLGGAVAEHAAKSGVASSHLSLSHDAGVAIAFVVLESGAGS